MPRLFTSIPTIERARVAAILRTEAVGGILVIVAAAVALVWANSPASDLYDRLCEYVVGPDALHLHLSLEQWAADGLLAIFFFVAGLELKREFVDGDLADLRRAALPVGAAVGGMLVPALIYVLVNLTDDGDLAGWAVPTATDIAFAVAVLAVISTHLPSGLRTFLLTLAVVDDLLAITVIALFYTDHLSPIYLAFAVLPIAGFAVVVRRGRTTWWLLLPLAAAAWWCVHASGVHATVAGVVLGFVVPVVGASGTAEDGMATHLEHVVRPVSAGVAVPLFAFFAAGVSLGGLDGIADSLTNPLTLGVIAGLVLGKPIGITLSTWLLATFTRAELDDGLTWIDVIGMAMLGGIGFTVSLLIGDLAFDTDAQTDHIKVGVLLGSLASALLAAVVLRGRNRAYRRIEERENAAR